MPQTTVGEKRGVPIKLFYELHGKGPKKILFIMGFLTTHHAWAPQISFFSQYSDEYQLCVFDNRGCGQSTASVLGYSSSSLAQDALELCDHLGWDKFHLVAISMGGMIAIELALHSIERILSLSLAVTHCGGISSLTPVVGIWKMTQSILSGFDINKRARVVQSMLYSEEFLAKPHENETMLDKVAKEWALLHGQGAVSHLAWGFLGHLKTVLTHSVSPHRLRKLKESGIPILIVTGTKDDLVPPINSHRLHQFLGDSSRFKVFEGAGHCINLECEDEFNDLILSNINAGTKSNNDTS